MNFGYVLFLVAHRQTNNLYVCDYFNMNEVNELRSFPILNCPKPFLDFNLLLLKSHTYFKDDLLMSVQYS